MRYQIVYDSCLCDKKTASGDWYFCYDEEQAKRRVDELHAAGYAEAYYEELPFGTAWFDDNNWIG